MMGRGRREEGGGRVLRRFCFFLMLGLFRFVAFLVVGWGDGGCCLCLLCWCWDLASLALLGFTEVGVSEFRGCGYCCW